MTSGSREDVSRSMTRSRSARTGGPRWLRGPARARRRAASPRSAFPTVRDEEWRFTNVAPLARDRLRARRADLAAPPSGCTASPTPTRRCGWWSSTAASTRRCRGPRGCPPACRPARWPARSNDHADVVQRYFGQLADFTQPQLHRAEHRVRRRTARSSTCPTASCSTTPIHVVFVVGRRRRRRSMAHPRTLDRRRRQQRRRGSSRATSAPRRDLLHQRRDGSVRRRERRASITTRCSRRSLDAFHIASLHVHTVAQRALLVALVRARRQARPQRRDRGARRRGRRLHAERPLSRPTASSSIDNHTTIDHAKPHCGSHEVYKGILGGTARAVFNGKIIVRQDAQKTDAKQTNRALLLSDDATINTKPQLEIFADDVKCTHGAAIGQLDDDAMFYLRARGLTLRRGARHADPRVRRRHPRPRQDRAAARARSKPSCSRSSRSDLAEVDGHDAAPASSPTRAATSTAPARRSTSQRVRADFPILSRTVHGKPLVYLDNAATTQKPQAVLDAMRALLRRRQRERPSRRARAERAGDRGLRGGARDASARSSTPRRPREIVFTRDATEGINLVAQTLRRAAHVGPGDEVRRSRRWSTTRTSCRGSWSARRRARRCASRRSTIAAS